MWWDGSMIHSHIWFSAVLLFIVIESGPLIFSFCRIDHIHIWCFVCSWEWSISRIEEAKNYRCYLSYCQLVMISCQKCQSSPLPALWKFSAVCGKCPFQKSKDLALIRWKETATLSVCQLGWTSETRWCSSMFSTFHNFCDCNRLIVNFPWSSLSLFSRASWCYTWNRIRHLDSVFLNYLLFYLNSCMGRTYLFCERSKTWGSLSYV